MDFLSNDYPSEIHYKIDWFTVIFENFTTMEVFKAIGLDYKPDNSLVEAFNQRFFMLGACGVGIDLVVDFPFCNLKYKQKEVQEILNSIDDGDLDAFDFMNAAFPYIRCDINGKALDVLRDRGVDVDKHFFNRFDTTMRREAGYHITRTDFAFDLLNYKPDFQYELEELIREVRDPDSMRVTVLTTKGSLKSMNVNIHNGTKGRTIYFGSGTSDRMLRIYDKAFEMRKKISEIPYYIENDDGTRIYPSSWCRIELQARREVAHSVLETSGGDFKQVFRFIYDNFAMTTGRRSKEIVQPWQELFDWSVILPIIQNLHFSTIEDTNARTLKYIKGQALFAIIYQMGKLGQEEFINLIQSFYYEMQTKECYKERNENFQNRLIFKNEGKLDHLIRQSDGIYKIE